MILGFILILIVIGSSIGLLVYSTVLPFIETLGTIKSYNSAYYGAIASVERAELVLKYKEPGFEGTGGRIGPSNVGPASDFNNNQMGQLSLGRNRMYRQIKSRTSFIPGSGTSNTPYIFKEGGNNNFNTLNYKKTEKINLGIDNTTDPTQYYNDTSTTIQLLGNGGNDTITVNMRLNPFIFNTGFNGTDLCFCDQDEDRSDDDKLISRSFGGKLNNVDYRINPRENLDLTQKPATIIEGDSFVREGNFVGSSPSPSVQLVFDNTRNPLSLGPDLSNEEYYTLIANNNALSGIDFSTLFSRTDTSDNYMTIELINKITTNNNHIYPFLDYQIDFDGKEVSDRFYTIQGIGRINDYNVIIKLYKPTNDDSTASDFTVIF